jgi:hypothetical protein
MERSKSRSPSPKKRRSPYNLRPRTKRTSPSRSTYNLRSGTKRTSPSRSKSPSPRKQRKNTKLSPPKVSIDLIRQNKDPLSKVMAPYLDVQSLKNLNSVNHLFNEISKDQLEIEKNKHPYKQYLRGFIHNFDSMYRGDIARVYTLSRTNSMRLKPLKGGMELLLSPYTEGFDFSKYIDPKILKIIFGPHPETDEEEEELNKAYQKIENSNDYLLDEMSLDDLKLLVQIIKKY